MANNIDSERLWELDTVGVLAAVGVEVKVRKLVYIPSTIDHDIVIQEYGAAAVLRDALTLKANHTDVNPVALDFGPECRRLNGFSLSTIDGGLLYVYLGEK